MRPVLGALTGGGGRSSSALGADVGRSTTVSPASSFPSAIPLILSGFASVLPVLRRSRGDPAFLSFVFESFGRSPRKRGLE